MYAWGVRNAVGIKFRPGSSDLWMSVNERDELGDGLVPDYISRVQPGGFYGWPWYYLGRHQDPRHKGKHPEFVDKVLVPDVLVQSHSASLNLCFYDGSQFPAEYRGDIFAAFHGSWNRKRRTGYKIVRVPFEWPVQGGLNSTVPLHPIGLLESWIRDVRRQRESPLFHLQNPRLEVAGMAK